MREADRIECRAMGRTPKEGLRIALRMSMEPLTVLKDGRPIAMMGVVSASLIEGRGTVWFLGTDQVYREGRALLTLGPPVFAAWLRDFRVIGNLVSTGNARALRLLARWGFIVGGAVETYGGVEFVPFRMERGSIQQESSRP